MRNELQNLITMIMYTYSYYFHERVYRVEDNEYFIIQASKLAFRITANVLVVFCPLNEDKRYHISLGPQVFLIIKVLHACSGLRSRGRALLRKKGISGLYCGVIKLSLAPKMFCFRRTFLQAKGPLFFGSTSFEIK